MISGHRVIRLLRLARGLIALGLIGLIALGIAGQLVRDRSVAWGVLMYLPLPLIGAGALYFDLICRGRGISRRRFRFVLAALGLITTLFSTVRLVGWGVAGTELTSLSARNTGQPFQVLHWNVVWGGGRRRNLARWTSIRQTIQDQGADVIVLSEAPPDDWLDELVAPLGPTASRVQIENEPGSLYWYKLVVCSKRPVRLIRREPLRGGVGMVVEVATDDGRRSGVVRLLVVDGISYPFQWRTPFLLDVARVCRVAAAAGEPFDLVVGDFNSMARSVGCDALAAEGYALASRSSRTWRGTFPAFAPLYDIDHVWVRRHRLPGLSCRTFTDFASDHRGQVARLWINSPGPGPKAGDIPAAPD